MAPLVEWCVANLHADARDRLRASAIRDRACRCLQRCDDCREAPFLVVGGVVRTGPSHAALLAEVEAR